MAAADHTTGVVLAATDVNASTNEIIRLRPLLDQIADLRGVVVTADALHCQRDHVTYLAARGAHWILTVKGNQPHLHTNWPGCRGGQYRTPTAPTAAAERFPLRLTDMRWSVARRDGGRRWRRVLVVMVGGPADGPRRPSGG